MSAHLLHWELIDFIAAGITPEQVISVSPSAEAQARVEELVAKSKDDEFSLEEQSELDC